MLPEIACTPGPCAEDAVNTALSTWAICNPAHEYTVAEFIDPHLGDEVNSGIGLT
jgi:hypothetical protein